ncbi:putidacin L1 family lectin-like bacteriocin [Pseudomonas sp. Marseille-Q5299]|uniref:putidacin L1 family lectin-like bacteriocin n=1 Tax=Pseudomonas sp. Marseille-Q5299 TaxID=2942201 RepID=UPI002072DDFB|nr:putidacin L1 family lectin-like bacteriocin [Pseudomonas sp. Marseille-Q5299]
MSDKYKRVDLRLKPFTGSGGFILPPHAQMSKNQFLRSPNGRYQFIYQDDGNIALYDGTTTIWVADKTAQYSSSLTRQVWHDVKTAFYLYYNLTLIDVEKRREWQTVASDPLGGIQLAADRTYMQLQDDGNLVIVDQYPRWSASGVPTLDAEQPATIIPAGTMMNPGDSFHIGKSRLVFQGDGNLVFYGENDLVFWASYTQNKGGAFAAMQDDGNFVIYNSTHQPIWSTKTAGFPDAYARIQENGCFAIVTDRVCWARFGFTPSIKPVRTISFGGNPYKDGLPTYDRVVWTF